MFGQFSRFDKWNVCRGWLGHQADRRQAVCSVVGLIGRHAVKARMRAAAIVQRSLRTPTGRLGEKFCFAFIRGLGAMSASNAMIERAGSVVFHCTLDGSDAARWLEIPAWMFDRALRPHEPCLTPEPFAGVEALNALSALLDQTLKTAMPRFQMHSGFLTIRFGGFGTPRPARSWRGSKWTSRFCLSPRLGQPACGWRCGRIGSKSCVDAPAFQQGLMLRGRLYFNDMCIV